MKSVQLLIDMAREKVRTDTELAERIGVHKVVLSEMRLGKRAVSPETVAALCDLLELPGEEAREWLAIAIIENPKNASKLEMLRRALFASWVLGVVSLAIGSTDAPAAQAVPASGTVLSAGNIRVSTTDAAVTFVKRTAYTLSRMLRSWLLGLWHVSASPFVSVRCTAKR